jgi:IS5 family transposase
LAFHLEDSASFRAFARLPLAWSPKKSVLHRTISAIRPATWEALNRALVASAEQEKLEAGAMVRIDSARHRGAHARAQRQRACVGCSARDVASMSGCHLRHDRRVLFPESSSWNGRRMPVTRTDRRHLALQNR